MNDPPDALTDSLNVIVMFASEAMWRSPSAGDELETDGAASFGVTKTGVSLAVHWAGSVTWRSTPVELAAQK